MSEQVAAVLGALQSYRRYFIACHVDPDPDCVGSMLAADWLLQRLGKEAIPLSHDPMLPQWRFLPRIDRVQPARDWIDQETRPGDALIVVDCDVERTGDAAALAERVECVVNIDHHVTNPGTGHVNLVRPQAAAAGELLFDIIKAAGNPLDPAVATLLYAAIMADTGSFRFGNTSARVFAIASELVSAGAEPDRIAREIYDTRSWNYVRLLSHALRTLGRSECGRVAWISLTNQMFAESGARRDESEGLIQYPRMIDGVEVAILFRELEQNGGSPGVRVSLRSRERVDVSALAQEFGGGGHERAAGFTLQGALAQVQERVLRRAIALAGDGQ